MHGRRSIWVGYDTREVLPYAVARASLATWCEQRTIHIGGVVLQDLIDRGWYWRPTEKREVDGKEILWDTISEAPMSTEFAISRFSVLELARESFTEEAGWAMFVDCDVLARYYIDDVFSYVENRCEDKALVCVQHKHEVEDGSTKKDGQVQTAYARKNWSSMMLLNRSHPANKRLTKNLINTVPGRDLHRFCWLEDRDIGSLDPMWNHLVGVPGAGSPNPRIVHFTNGGPWLPAYASVEYAAEWRAACRQWLR